MISHSAYPSVEYIDRLNADMEYYVTKVNEGRKLAAQLEADIQVTPSAERAAKEQQLAELIETIKADERKLYAVSNEIDRIVAAGSQPLRQAARLERQRTQEVIRGVQEQNAREVARLQQEARLHAEQRAATDAALLEARRDIASGGVGSTDTVSTSTGPDASVDPTPAGNAGRPEMGGRSMGLTRRDAELRAYEMEMRRRRMIMEERRLRGRPRYYPTRRYPYYRRPYDPYRLYRPYPRRRLPMYDPRRRIRPAVRGGPSMAARAAGGQGSSPGPDPASSGAATSDDGSVGSSTSLTDTDAATGSDIATAPSGSDGAGGDLITASSSASTGGRFIGPSSGMVRPGPPLYRPPMYPPPGYRDPYPPRGDVRFRGRSNFRTMMMM